ncbi:hypothetical protein KKIDH5335_01470 [Vibrio fluvialis]|nr:hypothetical protein KKIDH5335_01470 [Vibrio fluvialis]
MNLNLFKNKTSNAQAKANHTPRDSVRAKLITGNIENPPNKSFVLVFLVDNAACIDNKARRPAMLA